MLSRFTPPESSPSASGRPVEPARSALCAKKGQRRVVAISSGGGHWVELLRLRPAWAGCAVTYVTTHAGYRDEVRDEAAGFHEIPDANRWQRLRLVAQLFRIFTILVRVRPHVIVSTGAAPGYFALRFGRLLGARTIWVDSFANADELSMSGQLAGPHADLWLTQWEHLARPAVPNGPLYRGSVL